MTVTEGILIRKGARKVSEIPKEVLKLLDQGKIESVNLTEWLAVNHVTLLKNVLPTIGFENNLETILTEIEKENIETGIKVIRLIGNSIDKVMIEESAAKKEELIQKLNIHMVNIGYPT